MSLLLSFQLRVVVHKVEFDNEEGPSKSPGLLSESGRTASGSHTSRLTRFLHDMELRPNDPPANVTEQTFRPSTRRMSGVTSSAPTPALTAASSSTSPSERNPESDSFAYVETLLESLAVLGKLGTALDAIAQRIPNEIYALVESTLEEVADRAEFGRRTSQIITTAAGGAAVSGAVLMIALHDVGSVSESAQSGASALRLAALESSSKQTDHEILKDFFWTLYSKLDAVVQGLRLVYEVANRIGSVGGHI